ncbi:MAG: hypothetical protein IPO28_05545 [Holophagaceae bacterium]|nr:hypothetical protein [Holophagaceae bacterium]
MLLAIAMAWFGRQVPILGTPAGYRATVRRREVPVRSAVGRLTLFLGFAGAPRARAPTAEGPGPKEGVVATI